MTIESVHIRLNTDLEPVGYIVNNSIMVKTTGLSPDTKQVEEWLKTNTATNNLEGEEATKYEISVAINKINREYQAKVDALVDEYTPESEKSTWTNQEIEARAWKKDNSVNTPVIDGIVETREVEKAWLVDKVIEKADLYAIMIGKYVGERQKAEKEITNAN